MVVPTRGEEKGSGKLDHNLVEAQSRVVEGCRFLEVADVKVHVSHTRPAGCPGPWLPDAGAHDVLRVER
jgi:hypothetical protein